MFKYFHNSPKEESVYNLVTNLQDNHEARQKRDADKRDGKLRYRSIHSAMVREEAEKNKISSSKTMGVPQLPVEAPDLFLKKHSKRPLSMRPKSGKVAFDTLLPRDQSCQTDDNGESVTQKDINEASRRPRPKTVSYQLQRPCSTIPRKPPIPSSTLGVNYILQDTKDFIHSNALSIIHGTPTRTPPKPILYVDTPKGDTQTYQNSGLSPHYIHQPKFGNTPIYITLRKKEFLEQLKNKQEEKSSNSNSRQQQIRILTEEEKTKIILRLKQNWNQIFSFYQKLPLLIDTPGKIKRKLKMEDEMKKLETDIQTLQRHHSIYVSDIAPCSYYAFTGKEDTNK